MKTFSVNHSYEMFIKKRIRTYVHICTYIYICKYIYRHPNIAWQVVVICSWRQEKCRFEKEWILCFRNSTLKNVCISTRNIHTYIIGHYREKKAVPGLTVVTFNDFLACVILTASEWYYLEVRVKCCGRKNCNEQWKAKNKIYKMPIIGNEHASCLQK